MRLRSLWTYTILALLIGLLSCGGGSSAGNPGTPPPAPPPPPPNLPALRTVFFPAQDDMPESVIYDAARSRVYLSMPTTNRIAVLSWPDPKLIANVEVPWPRKIHMSLDGKQLIVGTWVEQVVLVDLVSLQVATRYDFPPVFNNGDPRIELAANLPEELVPLSNGKYLAIVRIGYSTGTDLALWNPATNTSRQLSPPNMGHGEYSFIGATADAAKVFVVSFTGDLAIYDVASDSFTESLSQSDNLFFATCNPIKRQLAVVGGNGIAFYDDHLRELSRAPVGHGGYYGSAYSPDGALWYLLTDSGRGTVIESYDTETFALARTAPAFQIAMPWSGGWVPKVIGAADPGFLVVSRPGGAVFDDATNVKNLGNASAPEITSLLPYNFAANSGGDVTIGVQNLDTTPDVWFGDVRGTSVRYEGTRVIATAPAMSTGLVDVKIVMPNGWFAYAPAGLSYGTQAPYLTRFMGSPQGGEALEVYGYGVPFDSQVSIGGTPATVLGPADMLGWNGVQVTTPPGLPGPADVTTTTKYGSFTLPKGFAYLKRSDFYPSSEVFTHILYDRARRQLYLSAGDHLAVFSLTSNQFLPWLTPPSFSGMRSLRGLALTPDGSRLLVANFADLSVAVIDPANPTGAQLVPIPPGIDSFDVGPDHVVATSNGKAFVTMWLSQMASGCQSHGLREIDLATLIATIPLSQPDCIDLRGMAVSSSTDGGKILIADTNVNTGSLWLWTVDDAKWHEWLTHTYLSTASVSGDGNRLSAGSFFLDAAMNLQMATYYPTYMYSYMSGHRPERLNSSGSLLFSPLSLAVHVVDVNHGQWLGSIAVPTWTADVPISTDIDETGTILYMINYGGISVLEMQSAPLSIGYVTPTVVSVSGGTQVTIRGSGFQQGSNAEFAGAAASTIFVDSSTLTVTSPPLAPGPARITVTNPNGDKYSLDASVVAK